MPPRFSGRRSPRRGKMASPVGTYLPRDDAASLTICPPSLLHQQFKLKYCLSLLNRVLSPASPYGDIPLVLSTDKLFFDDKMGFRNSAFNVLSHTTLTPNNVQIYDYNISKTIWNALPLNGNIQK
uniref:Protein FAM3D n=1 Tax=Panagrellus redivivus TaxID=6233 RepID=A0A7E4UQC0_PANRE